MSELQTAMQWLGSHDTGTSSKAIMRRMLGDIPSDDTYPSDGADLGRCIRLLSHIPAWRCRIGEMADCGYVWATLAAHWEELERMYHEELSQKPKKGGPYPLCDRMKQLQLAGLQADPMTEVRLRDDGTLVGWTRHASKETMGKSSAVI